MEGIPFAYHILNDPALAERRIRGIPLSQPRPRVIGSWPRDTTGLSRAGFVGFNCTDCFCDRFAWTNPTIVAGGECFDSSVSPITDHIS
jgi:hypothetical protein